MHLGSAEAEIFVLSFKDGLLSKVAHDLKLKCQSFELAVDKDAGTVQLEIDAMAIEVVCARQHGRDDHATLSGGDKKKILANLRDDVLQVRRYPKIAFSSSELKADGDHLTANGKLSLHGTTRSVSLSAKLVDGRYKGHIVLHQPDYGIKPFKAAFGALKIKPDVEVHFDLPAN